MKKKYEILLCFIFVITMSSCKSVIMKVYGISQPKVKTEKKIRKYIDKINMQQENQYTVNYSNFLELLEGKSIPRLELFDRQGKLLNYLTLKDCNAEANGLLRGLKPNHSYSSSDSIKLENLLEKLYNFQGDKVKFEEDVLHDYTAVIYWGTYVGRLNKRDAVGWIEDAISNEDSKIRLLKVNLDIQEWWGLDIR